MKLFGRKQKEEAETTFFDPAEYEPVIRASICTGERVACMRERATGKLHELMLIRSEEDIAAFCRRYKAEEKDLRTVY